MDTPESKRLNTQPSGEGLPSRIRSNAWYAGYSAHNGLGNILALVGPNTSCAFNTCGGAIFTEGLTPEEAHQIDLKIDDGMPLSGNVQAAQSENYIDGGPITPNLCVNGVDSRAATPYAPPATNSLTRCNLLFKIGF